MDKIIVLLLALSLPAYGQILMPIMQGVSGTQQASTPTDSPGQGTYGTTQSVTLSTATTGATICYRTDGVTPAATTPGTCDAGSTTYSGAFNVAVTTTVKALATKVGYTNSSVLTSVYTISSGKTIIQSKFGTSSSAGNCSDNGGANSMTCDFPAGTSAGSFIGVMIATSSTSVLTVSDDKSNSYTCIQQNNSKQSRFCYVINATAGVVRITVTGTNFTNSSMGQFEMGGTVTTAAAIDGSASALNGFGQANPQSSGTTGALNYNDDFIISGFGQFQTQTGSFTITGTGFSELGHSAPTGGGGGQIVIGQKSSSGSTSAVTCTADFSTISINQVGAFCIAIH